MKNSQVVSSWLRGSVASAANLTTSGQELWSYNQLIGFTKEGQKVVVDHTAPAGGYLSQTTSCHVNLAKRYADRVVPPYYVA